MNENQRSNKALYWAIGLGFVAVLGLMGQGGQSPSKSKPAVGTDACLDRQLDASRSLPDREPYDQQEVDDVFANLGGLCESGRVTRR